MNLSSRQWFFIAGIVVAAVFIQTLKPILAPFLVAGLLAYLGDPIVDRLEARGLSRSASVATVFLVITLNTALAILIALPLLSDQIQLLGQKLQLAFVWSQNTLMPMLRDSLGLPEGSKPLETAKEAVSRHWNEAGGIVLQLWRQVSGSSLALSAWVANMALIPVVTYYMLRDWDVMVAKIRDLLPRSIEPKAVELGQECDEILSAFMRGQLVVMGALTLVYTVGLWLVGIDLALVLGLVAGLASIVPYLGFIVGVVAASIAAYYQFSDFWALAQVLAVFGVGQLLESMWLTPNLVGDRIGLHPVMVIFAILAGGQLFGFVGVLLALPAAAVIKVMVMHLHASYKSSELYATTDEPIEEPSLISTDTDIHVDGGK